MYTYKVLQKSDWNSYRHLMIPTFYKYFKTVTEQSCLKMIGAELFGNPVGIAILELDLIKGTGFMHHLYVRKEHRRRGLATELLDRFRSICRQHNIDLIRFEYYAQENVLLPIDAWLLQQGSTKAKMTALVFRINRRIAQAPWLREQKQLNEVRIIPWQDIEDKELEKLQSGHLLEYESFLSPFKSFAPIEPLNSLGLISSSGVEGWSISYRIREDIILYDALFVSTKYQSSGIPFMMLSKAIRLHMEKVDQIPYGMFAVNIQTERMFRLASKWIKPYAIKISEKRRRELYLK